MASESKSIPCYYRFELWLDGPSAGNPFLDVTVGARFEHGGRSVDVDGFYDGDGRYGIRFMPEATGTWRYTTRSNAPGLDGVSGSFECGPARAGVRGPVRVSNQFHFSYADGTTYLPFGTTCYAWTHQPLPLQEQTLGTLAGSPFNKLRMCVFPKHYRYNNTEPLLAPYESTASGWDFDRPSPAFYRHLESRIAALADLGIQADLIVLHPYDRWGFAHMGRTADEQYLRYIVARLAAYDNVWWSLANEYDLMRDKTLDDWHAYFQLIQQHDRYQHPRSIHNWQRQDTHDTATFYDHGLPWVTHCSIQHSDADQVAIWRERYGKPVVIDECAYEGNIPPHWGNLTPEEMVRRCWDGAVRGGYVGHGETYLDPDEVLWWSKGGVLHGQSAPRIAFLRQIMEGMPPGGLDPQPGLTDTGRPAAGRAGQAYLVYFGNRQPALATLNLPEGQEFSVDIIDTWNTTIAALPGLHCKGETIDLPGRPYLALRMRA